MGKGKKIVILGTLDTKGDQLVYLREKIRELGHFSILIDLSTGSEPSQEADVTSAEIASIVGEDIKKLRESKDRALCAEVMAKGAEQKVLELLARGDLDGIAALGGATIAGIASKVMQKLPFGIPKIMGVTAIMPVYVREWFNAMDIVVMQMIMEMAGMNDLVKNVIERFAGTIVGTTEQATAFTTLKLPYPSIAITEYGPSQKCAEQVRKLLEERGYHVFSFHAQGISDRAMEKLISQGLFDGLIDIVPSGLSDELTQGNRAAGKKRLDAAAERGIPQVLAPAGINMTGCGPTRRNREKYASRPRILKMDEIRWMTRYTPEELKEHAKVYAEKLNKAKGPTVFLFPLRGWCSLDREGSVLFDPVEDKVFIEEFRKHLNNPKVEIKEIDCNLEDHEFAEALVNNFEEIFQKTKERRD